MTDDLFQFRMSLDDKLENYRKNGKIFLSVAQASKCLGITCAEVRYGILFYRLDALLVTGEYRIALDWVKAYSTLRDSDENADFYNVMTELEISGIHDLVFHGKVQPLVVSMKESGHSLSDIPALLKKNHQYQYSEMEGSESAPQDWYSLGSLLPWPQECSITDWAHLLSVKGRQLAWEMNLKQNSLLRWPEFYDFLIEREVANLPCPFDVKKPKQSQEQDSQGLLF